MQVDFGSQNEEPVLTKARSHSRQSGRTEAINSSNDVCTAYPENLVYDKHKTFVENTEK